MALPFVACNKEELTEPVSKGEQISISVKATAEDLPNLADTKTYIDGMNVLWSANEQMSIFLINGNTAASATSTDFTGEGEAEAMFAFNFNSEDIPANGPYTYGGVYPASADKGLTKGQTTDKVELPATQNATATSYDPAAYIMVAKPESFETVQTEWIASYRRATALNKITLTGISEDIASVAITVPEGKYLAGRRYIDVATGESGEIYGSGYQTNTITVNYATALPHTAADVWFTSWGVEVAEGEAVTVKVTTVTNKAYTKTFNARAEGIKFTENYLNTLAVDMSDAIAEETGLPLPFTEDFSEVTGSNTSVDALAQFDKTGSIFSVTDGAIRLGTKSANGKITTKSALDLSKPFTVIVYGTGWADDERTLEISAGSQTKSITFNTDKELNTQYVEVQYVYFEAETDMTKVSFTNKDGRVILNSIEIVSEEWIPTPEIMVTENSKTVNYDAESVEFSYITMGITGDITVTETSDVDNIVSSASATDGIVSVSLVPNTEEREKTATIELSYEGAEPVTLTIKQNAKPAAGAKYYVKVTEELTDWSGQYLIVYEDMSVALDGSLTSESDFDAVGDHQTVSIETDRILSTSEIDKISFTIASISGGYSIQGAAGYYIYNSNSKSNDLKASNTETGLNTISIEEGSCKIVSETTILRFNTTGDGRFRYYKSSSYASQKPIQLYKLQ